MKDHVKDPSVFDICPISTNNSSDATHYKRRTQYQQNNVWIAIQICLALYTYNLNIKHQWFFYTCVTICNMDLYIIKKGAGSFAYVMLWKQSLIDDIFYISINSLVGFFFKFSFNFFNYLSHKMIPVDIFIRKLWTTVVNKFEDEKKWGKNESWTRISHLLCLTEVTQRTSIV